MIFEAISLSEALNPYLIEAIIIICVFILFTFFCIMINLTFDDVASNKTLVVTIIFLLGIAIALCCITQITIDLPYTEELDYIYDAPMEIINVNLTSDGLYNVIVSNGVSVVSFFTRNDDGNIVNKEIPLSDVEIQFVETPEEVGVYKYEVKSTKHYESFNVTCEAIIKTAYKLKVLD